LVIPYIYIIKQKSSAVPFLKARYIKAIFVQAKKSSGPKNGNVTRTTKGEAIFVSQNLHYVVALLCHKN
jgi:zona occludens toxin (predicted ATPase)